MSMTYKQAYELLKENIDRHIKAQEHALELAIKWEVLTRVDTINEVLEVLETLQNSATTFEQSIGEQADDDESYFEDDEHYDDYDVYYGIDYGDDDEQEQADEQADGIASKGH
jgi:hypothetical protein